MKYPVAILIVIGFVVSLMTIAVVAVGWIAIPIALAIAVSATLVTWAVVTLAKQQSKK